jgi:hypothetical protein
MPPVKQIPIVIATVSRGRVTVRCPYCDRLHRHTFTPGHHAAPCGFISAENIQGYIIVLPTQKVGEQPN